LNLADLRTLLDYHYWARDRLLDALDGLSGEEWTRELGGSFPTIRDTAGHIYSAEWAWHARWTGVSPTALLPPETFPDARELRRLWKELERRVRDLLEELGEEGTQRTMSYRLLSGAEGASVFWHMLQHVVNHASYHRGQITTLLRQVGRPGPKPTDLIAYYRSRSQ
jgi:uncharacterized damage-inducible protein DinB